MATEAQEPTWGPQRQPQSPVEDDVSAVGAGRSGLTGRQKIGILIGAGAVVLAVIFLTHLPGHRAGPTTPKISRAGIGQIGTPFRTPAEKPAPKSATASPPLPARHPAPFAATMLGGRQETPAERALNAPILAYGSGSAGGAAGSAAQGTAGGSGPSAHMQPTSPGPLTRDLTASSLRAADATVMPHPDYTIAAGTIIPCTLQTAIDSGLPGFVKCVLPQPIRSMTGTITLLDRGTQVIGEVRQGLVQGQDRLFILWTRAVTPENVVINLASPAADSLGRAGVSGAVDNHFWQRFGAAIMLTIVGGSLQAGANAAQSGTGNSYFEYFNSNTNQIANTALQSTIDIPPTLRKNQGDNVSIFVARDLSFYKVYKLTVAMP